ALEARRVQALGLHQLERHSAVSDRIVGEVHGPQHSRAELTADVIAPRDHQAFGPRPGRFGHAFSLRPGGAAPKAAIPYREGPPSPLAPWRSASSRSFPLLTASRAVSVPTIAPRARRVMESEGIYYRRFHEVGSS